MSLDTTPRTWLAGETVTTTMMNTEIRDAFTGLQAAWTPYTATPTGFSVGNGSLVTAYHQVGQTFKIRGSFVGGSTSTYSGNFQISIPSGVTPISFYTTPADGVAVGAALIAPNGTGATRQDGSVFITASGLLALLCATGTVSNTVPAAWAASSAASFSFLAEFEVN